MAADIAKAKRNVARMIAGGASESEIDGFLESQGLSAAHLRGEKVPYTSVQENFTKPITNSANTVKQKWDAMMKDKTGRERGPGLGDLANVVMSPMVGASDVVTRPAAQWLTNTLGAPKTRSTTIPEQLQSLVKDKRFLPFEVPTNASEFENKLNSDIGMALSMGMPGKGAVGRVGPQIPQGLRAVKGATDEERVIRKLIKTQKLGDVKAKVEAAAKQGIELSPVDIVDNIGRARMMKAAAMNTPGRIKVADAADQAVVNFPDRVSKQVRRNISKTPRGPEAVAQELEDIQGQMAREGYREPYQQPLQLDNRLLGALKSEEGHRAIDEALKVARERPEGDPAMQGLSDISRMMQPRYNQGGMHNLAEVQMPSVPASVLDRIQIALRQRSKNLLKGENANAALAGTVRGRRNIVNAALDEVSGLQEARGNYAMSQKIIDAAEGAPMALRPGTTEELGQLTQGLDMNALAPARDVLAHEMIGKLGERTSAAPGTAKMMLSPQPQERMGMLVPQENLANFSAGTQIELDRLKHITDIAPDRGLKALLVANEDMSKAQDLGDFARAGLASTSPVGKIHAAFIGMKAFARHMGMSTKEAEILSTLAIDPTKTAEVVRALSTRYGTPKAIKLTMAAKAYAA